MTSALAIIPLAGWMGRATEHLAEKLGEGVGGLLNATFGNAAELIIALMALRAGLFDVVKASITGSIIGNALLVLGVSVLAGGLKYPKQRFNTAAAMLGSTMLALSAIGLLMPAVFHSIVRHHPQVREQNLSLEIAIVLFITYVLSLIFTLRTHAHLYVGDLADEEEEAIGTRGWSQQRSMITLLVATALVAVMSEFLVGAVEAASRAAGLTEIFVGVIVVAIIGNAAEHSTAVMMALKNKIGLALNIAIGSSLQIALFVAPVLVFASYAVASRPMDLLFTSLEIIAIAVSVAVVALIAQDGESNWMEGVLLLAVYAILGLTFYFLPAA
jgi:Ca2+:H+ antiporter